MKTLFPILYLILITINLLGVTSQVSANTKSVPDTIVTNDSHDALPTIHLITPNGGEQYAGISVVVVEWNGTNLSFFHLPKIEISLDGGVTWTISDFFNGISASEIGGSAYIELPATISSEVKLRLSDFYHPEISDESDNNFAITSPQTLIVTIGGYNYNKITSNSTVEFALYFVDSFSQDYFTLLASYDGGNQWNVVKQHVIFGSSNFDLCFWEIPENVSGICQIKFVSENVPGRYGISPPFTIYKIPKISISANIQKNLVHTDSTFTFDYHKIDEFNIYNKYSLSISTDKGVSWNFLKALTFDDNEGHFQVTALGQETDSCLFRISDDIHGNSTDTSVYITFRNFPSAPICKVTIDASTKKNVIKWSKPVSNYITQYIVYRETDITDVYEEIGRVPKSNPSEYVDLTSLPDQRAYRYRLSYIDNENMIYPLSDPHQTIHLSVYKNPENHYNLIWNPYTGADIKSFVIYRGTTVNNLTEITRLSGNNGSYTDSDSPQGNVYYRIEAIGTGDCSGGDFVSTSNTANESSLGIDEDTDLKGFSVFPNPTSDIIYLTFKNVESAVVYSITDMRGKVLTSEQVNTKANQSVAINVADFNNGLYLIKLRSDKFTSIQKIIISH